MKINLREGFKRICILWSSLIAIPFLLWASYEIGTGGYLKSFYYYNPNAPQYAYGSDYYSVEIQKPAYEAYNNLVRQVSNDVRQGYLSENEARGMLDRKVANGAYTNYIPYANFTSVKVPLLDRINWDGVDLFIWIVAVVIFWPWAFYWAGVYIGRGLKKSHKDSAGSL